MEPGLLLLSPPGDSCDTQGPTSPCARQGTTSLGALCDKSAAGTFYGVSWVAVEELPALGCLCKAEPLSQTCTVPAVFLLGWAFWVFWLFFF